MNTFAPSSITQGSLPTVTDVIVDGNGNVVNLTGCTVQFIYQGGPCGRFNAGPPVFLQTRTATIVDPATGAVSYTFQPGETNQLGAYLCQWLVTLADTVTQLVSPPAEGVFQATPNNVLMKWPDGTWHVVQRIGASAGSYTQDVQQTPTPTGGWNELTIVAPGNMTPICDLFELVRPLVGDFDPCEPIYEDATLYGVIRGIVRFGRLNVLGPTYTLTPDRRSITPALPDGPTLALAVLYAAKNILRPTMGASSYRTRAMSESFGAQRDYLWDLMNDIWEMENPGNACSTFQTFYGWVNATTGLNIYALLTDFNNAGSVATVSLGPAGLQVATQM